MTETRLSRLITTADGTRVHATLHNGDRSKRPLLCLPGLTRNSRDFEPVVERFAGTRPILTMDFRGRGKSDYAADPMTYRPDVELADTVSVLDAFAIERVALLGTSRGGIVGMLLAASQPQLLAALFLNDIGAAIEAKGLLKIMSYVGVDVSYPDWPSAARAFAAARGEFSGVVDAQWLSVVKRVYRERDGRIQPDYDLKLAVTLPNAKDVNSGKLPQLWGVLPALSEKPVSILRGAQSDLLSSATVARMKSELPQLDDSVVPNRGHVPFLDEPESIAALERFLERVDGVA